MVSSWSKTCVWRVISAAILSRASSDPAVATKRSLAAAWGHRQVVCKHRRLNQGWERAPSTPVMGLPASECPSAAHPHPCCRLLIALGQQELLGSLLWGHPCYWGRREFGSVALPTWSPAIKQPVTNTTLESPFSEQIDIFRRRPNK